MLRINHLCFCSEITPDTFTSIQMLVLLVLTKTTCPTDALEQRRETTLCEVESSFSLIFLAPALGLWEKVRSITFEVFDCYQRCGDAESNWRQDHGKTTTLAISCPLRLINWTPGFCFFVSDSEERGKVRHSTFYKKDAIQRSLCLAVPRTIRGAI